VAVAPEPAADARTTDLVVRLGEADAPVTDLVVRLNGPWRRLGDEHLPRNRNVEMREWMLTVGIRELSRMLRPDSPSLDVAERLLSLILNDDRSTIRVVWLTNTHYVVCENTYSTQEGEDDAPHDYFECVTLHCEELRSYYLRLFGAARGILPDPDVLRVLHRLAALCTIVKYAMVDINEALFPDMLPGIDDFVSMARSRRRVTPLLQLTSGPGRALAYNCNPLVSLEANLDFWNDHGAALVEAMVENKCPAALIILSIPARLKRSLAAAIAATSILAELSLPVPSLSHDTALFDAIGQNQNIRVLRVYIREPLSEAATSNLERFWMSMFQSSSIESINVAGHTVADGDISEAMRRQNAELVAKHIRNSQRITCLKCNPATHDAEIMESRVAPIVHWNRFRPIVAGRSDGEGRKNRVSALIGSPLVRRHPALMYHLLKKNPVTLLPS
jgi:hypothetical protein